MRLRLPFVVLTALALALPAAIELSAQGLPPGSIEWNQPIPLNPPDPCQLVPGSVEGRGVAIGPDQNPVAVGEVAGLSRVVVVKYDGASGERLWCNSFQVRAAAAKGTSFLVPFAKIGGVAIDASGTIFIAGDGGTAPFPPPPPAKPGVVPESPVGRYFVTKCSSVGACASTVTFINPTGLGSHNDTIGDIAVGPDGNPVLTGIAAFPTPVRGPGTFKLLTVKVDGSSFTLLGQADAPSSAPIVTSSQGVAVDSSNNIFVTGTQAYTSKYDSSLSSKPLWMNRLAGARIAASGDPDEVAVIRTAVPAVNAGQNFEVTKLDGKTGAALWTSSYDSGFNDIPRDVALDGSGNILVAGDLSRQGQLVSFGRTGDVNWVVGVPTTGDSSRHSFSTVAVGADGGPVVSGYSESGSAVPTRVMETIKYTFDRLETDRLETDDERSDGGEHGKRLAWDEATDQTVTGFRVCIDGQSGRACQDVGKPKGHTFRATMDGDLTYRVALKELIWLTGGRHAISVIAYNGDGDSVSSEVLFVEEADDKHDHSNGKGPK